MYPSDFDAVSRALASTVSRRELLKLAVASVASALAASVAAACGLELPRRGSQRTEPSRVQALAAHETDALIAAAGADDHYPKLTAWLVLKHYVAGEMKTYRYVAPDGDFVRSAVLARYEATDESIDVFGQPLPPFAIVAYVSDDNGSHVSYTVYHDADGRAARGEYCPCEGGDSGAEPSKIFPTTERVFDLRGPEPTPTPRGAIDAVTAGLAFPAVGPASARVELQVENPVGAICTACVAMCSAITAPLGPPADAVQAVTGGDGTSAESLVCDRDSFFMVNAANYYAPPESEEWRAPYMNLGATMDIINRCVSGTTTGAAPGAYAGIRRVDCSANGICRGACDSCLPSLNCGCEPPCCAFVGGECCYFSDGSSAGSCPFGSHCCTVEDAVGCCLG